MPIIPPGGVPTLEPYQMWFNGLTFAGIDPATSYQLQKATGLDHPAIRSSDLNRPRDQGAFAGLNLLGPRTITFELIVISDGVSLQHAAEALAAAFVPGVIAETPLYLQLPNRPLLGCSARATKYNWPLDISYVLGPSFIATCALVATDPRWYVGPTTVTGPVDNEGTVVLDNSGDFEMRPILVVTGPATGIHLDNDSIPGADLSFTNPYADTDLGADDSLIIDLDLHSVVWHHKDGLVYFDYDVPYWVETGSVWWNLPPGDNTIFYSSDSGTGSLSIQWAPAYLSA